jgi:uncharacterized integral membrane protein
MSNQKQTDSGIWPMIKKYRKEIWVGFLVIVALLFLIWNSDDVTFHLVFFKLEAPLILLLGLFAAIGAGIVAIYWRFSHMEQKFKIKELQKEIEGLKQKPAAPKVEVPQNTENPD